MRARAAQPRTTRHAGKVNARALKAKGHGGPNTTGYARHSPLHAARRVEAEWEDSSCPGGPGGAKGGEKGNARGYMQNFALQGQACTLLRAHVRQVREA